MLNVKRVFSGCLFVTLTIASATLPGASTVVAQPAIAQAQLSWKGLIERILGRKEPRDGGPSRRGGPRPPDLCWLTPTETVWHTRPVFVWLGGSRLMGVRLKGEDTVLWQQVATTNMEVTESSPARYVVMSEAPLPPGNYEWLFFDQTTRSLRLRVPFQVMDGNKRALIMADLAKLDAKLNASGTKGDAIALQRANFFAERHLWSDAMQEIYAVKQPSAELQQVAQAIEQEICASKSVP